MKEQELDLSEPQEEIVYSTSHFNLFMAGVGSAKTHLFAYISADFIINHPEIIGFIGTNTYDQLSKSTLNNIFKVWQNTFGWIRDVDYVVDRQPPAAFKKIGPKLKTYANTISFNNGALIFTASLENYKAIDGTEFGWGMLDETKDTREEAVKEVIIERLRQPGMWVHDGEVFYGEDRDKMIKAGTWEIREVDGTERTVDAETGEVIAGWNPLYIATSPSKQPWLNEWFGITQDKADVIGSKVLTPDDYYHEANENYCTVISSTYHNQHNLTEGYIDRQKAALSGNEGLINMMIYGYPFAKSGGEWIWTFDRSKHVKECQIDTRLPLHISLDFNVAPHMTMLVIQIDTSKNRTKVRVCGEICPKHPKNNTPDLCNLFIYHYAGKINGLYYYGDPSGRNRQTVTKDVRDNYDALRKVLRDYLHNGSDRVISSHSSLIRTRDFLNRCFDGYYDLDIEIDPSCKTFLSDIDLLMEDKNGGFKKLKVKDKKTGETYEKNGHAMDAFKDLMVSAFPRLFDKVNE